MRYDIRLMWVEDMPRWYNEAKEIIEMDIEDECLTADIEYVSDAKTLLEKLQRQQEGFKLFDIFFIDYSLSNGMIGSNIIRELRRMNIDSDILFYSSDKEETIRQEIIDDLGSFEGVYIANRDNFREKSLYLIKKNAKKLLSLSNIRGLLMDHTSENDYIILSYLYKKYDVLNETQKKEIEGMVLNYMISKQKQYEDKSKKEIERINKNGIKNINKFLKLPSYLVPLSLKYKIFEMMITFNSEEPLDKHFIEGYFGNVVGLRNKVAHKKLDVCRMQKNILYYDNINQFDSRKCPVDCEGHTNEHKISVEEWMELRKEVIEYGKYFDIVLNEIIEGAMKEAALGIEE